jgi:hypothetical protein
MRHRALFFLFLFLLATSMNARAQADIPTFVADLIAQYKSVPAGNSPGSIWRYKYKGRVVYYVPPLYCCDIMSRLYDSDGNVMCRPEGGIAGSGDGLCVEFLRARSDGELLWSDGTSQGSR